MPERILYTLLLEADRMNEARQQMIAKVCAGKKPTAVMALPPFIED